MPAARRYDEPLIDAIGQAIAELPDGTPPVATCSKQEALDRLRPQIADAIRRHVSLPDLVGLLQDRGLKVTDAELRRLATDAKPRQRRKAGPKTDTVGDMREPSARQGRRIAVRAAKRPSEQTDAKPRSRPTASTDHDDT